MYHYKDNPICIDVSIYLVCEAIHFTKEYLVICIDVFD